jgi:hypothetical protein
LSATRLTHPLPKSDGFSRVIPSPGHVNQTNFVRFGLVFATEREQDTKLRAGPEGGENCLLLPHVHVAESERRLRAHHYRVGDFALQNPL